MIVVTGSKRSGTSLWMQIVIAAGFPYIGRDFSKNWKDSIFDANPHGFYESLFRRGIYHINNPNPQTGHFVPAIHSQLHAIKIFIPGLVRTDLSYLHRVICSIRHFREYFYSLQRLDTMEQNFYQQQEKQSKQNPKNPNIDLSFEEIRNLRKNPLHPVIEWWQDNYLLIRDFSTRRYPFHCVAYDSILERPQEIIPKTLTWCFNGLPTDLRFFDENLHRETSLSKREHIKLDIDAACNVIQTQSKTQKRNELPDIDFPFKADFEDLFETFYDCFYSQNANLSASLIEELNKCHDTLEPYIKNEIQKHQLYVAKILQERNISPQQFESLRELREESDGEETSKDGSHYNGGD